MEKVVHKFKSFKEQEDFERDFWRKVSIAQKFDAVETARAIYISTFHPEVKGIEKVVTKRNLHDEE